MSHSSFSFLICKLYSQLVFTNFQNPYSYILCSHSCCEKAHCVVIFQNQLGRIFIISCLFGIFLRILFIFPVISFVCSWHAMLVSSDESLSDNHVGICFKQGIFVGFDLTHIQDRDKARSFYSRSARLMNLAAYFRNDICQLILNVGRVLSGDMSCGVYFNSITKFTK